MSGVIESVMDKKELESLEQGGKLLKKADKDLRTTDDVLNINEQAAMQILLQSQAEGLDVSKAVLNRARRMLMLVEFIRSMNSLDDVEK